VFAFHSHAVHLQQGRAAVKNLSRLKIISVYVDTCAFHFCPEIRVSKYFKKSAVSAFLALLLLIIL